MKKCQYKPKSNGAYLLYSSSSYFKYLIVEFTVKATTRLRPTVAQAKNIPCTKNVYASLYKTSVYLYICYLQVIPKVARWT